MRASPLLEYSSTTLAIVTIVGSCTALFAASIALVHNDIKKVIAYSTMSQLGYTFLACGISQYDIAIFHIVNHGFFVWQDRYFNIKFSPNLISIFNKGILTYKSLKFKLYFWWERLTKVNSCKNCNNVIKLFYENIFLYVIIIIQEKIIIGLHYIIHRCRIERILISYIKYIYILLHIYILCKIIKILNLGKPVIYNLLLKWATLSCKIFNYILQSGCRIFYQANALGNAKDKLLLTKSRDCWIRYSFYKVILNDLNEFKTKCKNIFKINLSINEILPKLNQLINEYKYKHNHKFNKFMKNYIHNRAWIWAKKKYHKLGKNKLYSLFFKPNNKNFSSLNFNRKYNTYNNINKCNIDFPIGKSNLKFINVEANYFKIVESLNKLGGIYIFWLLEDPTKCYIGSAQDLKKRFKAHYNLNRKSHQKFYNTVKKYSWSNFGFQIIELINNKNNNLLLFKEQFWLNVIFDCPCYGKNNILNLLKNANNWSGYKHSEESKMKMRLKKINIKLTDEHKTKISLGKISDKHYYFGKKRNSETIKKMSDSAKLAWKILKENNYKISPKSESTKLKMSKSIIFVDTNNNQINYFKTTISAMQYLKISHAKLKHFIDNKLLYIDNLGNKFYIKQIINK
jgi:group I intron endonuclease